MKWEEIKIGRKTLVNQIGAGSGKFVTELGSNFLPNTLTQHEYGAIESMVGLL